MKKFICRLFCISLFLIATVYPPFAFAKTINVEVLPNRTELIYRYVLYNRDTCGAMAVPKMKVMSVGHGKIKGRKGGFWIESGHCKGIKMKGIDIYYTPKSGFRGVDNAKVNLSMPAFADDSGHSVETLNFRIRVTNTAKRVKKKTFRPKPRTVNPKKQICFDCSKGSYAYRASLKVTCVPENDPSLSWIKQECKKLDKKKTYRPKPKRVKPKNQICFDCSKGPYSHRPSLKVACVPEVCFFCKTRLSFTSKEGKICVSVYDRVDIANLGNYCNRL